ncbi:MAG: hypothetical protein ABR598_08755 [Candidatus Dormibacteria bacterium]
MQIPRPVSLAVALMCLTGCGSESACVAAGCAVTTPTSSPTGRRATAGDWRTDASVAAGRVEVTVTVSGPASVEGGCVPALTAWLADVHGQQVGMAATPGLRCQAISITDIPAGETRDFHVSLPQPPPGTYTVHGLIRTRLPIGADTRVTENIPVVSVSVP